MPSSISKFRSTFTKELARPNKFEVFIPIPVQLVPYYSNAQTLSMRCESTELPSRSTDTLIRKIGSVPAQKFPYQSLYNDITMTFIVSGDMGEKILFDAWMELINPSSNFNFNYKKTYVTEIAIKQYDLTHQLSYEVILIDAFPIAVNQLDLNWSDDGYHKLSVVFAYTYWTNGTLNQIGKNILTQGLSGLLGSLGSL